MQGHFSQAIPRRLQSKSLWTNALRIQCRPARQDGDFTESVKERTCNSQTDVPSWLSASIRAIPDSSVPALLS